MERINWSYVIAVTLVVVFVLLITISLLDTTNWKTNRAGMRSGGWSIWRAVFAPFMFLMPLAWLALPILGVTCMVRRLSSGSGSRFAAPISSRARTCQKCGRALEADWQSCPYCGHKL